MIVLYARLSTTDQTTALQRSQAEQAGFKIDKVVADEGINGVSTELAERPEGKRLFDMLRAGDTLVVRWVDRLGRNYTDVVDTMREFMRYGVIITHQRHDVRWQDHGADKTGRPRRAHRLRGDHGAGSAEATKSARGH
jgi:DNA invertase Pin-like site-specific DNA recombinase